jgi:hypothetical protein
VQEYNATALTTVRKRIDFFILDILNGRIKVFILFVNYLKANDKI